MGLLLKILDQSGCVLSVRCAVLFIDSS